jgi:hypothetical protein
MICNVMEEHSLVFWRDLRYGEFGFSYVLEIESSNFTVVMQGPVSRSGDDAPPPPKKKQHILDKYTKLF